MIIGGIMRKLKLQMQLTINGFVGGTNGEMDWMTLPWTEDINKYVSGIINNVDTIILGRKLAEGFIPYWADIASKPDNPEVESGKKFTSTPKIVFSKTIINSPWPNTIISNGDIVDEIKKLKNQDGKDIYACGGSDFVSSLIQNNLIDEYYLFTNPVMISKGKTIFKKLEDSISLKIEESLKFECGIVLNKYNLIS